MTPEVTLLRESAIQSVPMAVDKAGRMTACVPNGGRFGNPFIRDYSWALRQSLSQIGNRELFPLIIPLAMRSIDAALEHQSKGDPRRGIRKGKIPHEIQDKYTSRERINELIDDGWGYELDKEKNPIIISSDADDTNALVVIGARYTIDAQKIAESENAAMEFLRRSWEGLKLSTEHDIRYADPEGDGLIKSDPRKKAKIFNRTWRDSSDAFLVYRNGVAEIPTPRIFFANACFHIEALEDTAALAEMMGEDKYAKKLRKRREMAMENLHKKFWWDEEQTYVPLISAEGEQVQILTNEVAIGLLTNALYPDRAEKSARRTLDNDFLNKNGTRTRSIADPGWYFNGKPAYHRNPDWLQMDTSFTLGLEQYNLNDMAEIIRGRCISYVKDNGFKELRVVDKDGETHDYYEDDNDKEDAACTPQTWGFHGFIAVTAPKVELPLAA